MGTIYANHTKPFYTENIDWKYSERKSQLFAATHSVLVTCSLAKSWNHLKQRRSFIDWNLEIADALFHFVDDLWCCDLKNELDGPQRNYCRVIGMNFKFHLSFSSHFFFLSPNQTVCIFFCLYILLWVINFHHQSSMCKFSNDCFFRTLDFIHK